MEVVHCVAHGPAEALVDTPPGVEKLLEIRKARLGQVRADRHVVKEIMALQRQFFHGTRIEFRLGEQADGMSPLRKGAEQVICMHMVAGDARPGQRFLDEEQTHARIPTRQERNFTIALTGSVSASIVPRREA